MQAHVDLALFHQSQRKVTIFGLITTTLPLLLGMAVALWFGYPVIPAIVVGSLLASHTLLGIPIIKELGATRLEPVTVTCVRLCPTHFLSSYCRLCIDVPAWFFDVRSRNPTG